MFNTILLFSPFGVRLSLIWGSLWGSFLNKNRTRFHLILNTHFNIVFVHRFGVVSGSMLDYFFNHFFNHFFKMRKLGKLMTVQGKCLIFQGLGGQISMIFLPFFDIIFYITFFIDFPSIFARSWGPFGPLGASFFDTFFDTIFRTQKNTKKHQKKNLG